MNKVIAGDYVGNSVLWDGASMTISGMMSAKCKLDKSTVASYNLVNSTRSFFGGDSYTVSVEFIDGKKSLLSLSGGFYETLIRILF